MRFGLGLSEGQEVRWKQRRGHVRGGMIIAGLKGGWVRTGLRLIAEAECLLEFEEKNDGI